MKKKKILIIKMAYDSFQKFYDEQFIKMGCDICTTEKLLAGIGKQSMTNIQMYKYIKEFAKQNNWKQYDNIILFDTVFLIPPIFFAKGKKTQLSLWIWNTIEPVEKRRLSIAKLFSNVFTFDPGDSNKYNIGYAEQFYFRNIENYSHSNNHTIFFVGADKGRADILAQLIDELEDIKPSFFILKDHAKKYDKKLIPFLIDERLDYSKVLSNIKKCDIVLDLVKNGQTGMTVRIIEAIFYDKKIISNNLSLVQSDLFETGNIYILGISKGSIKDFIKKDVIPYSSELKEKYSAEHWFDTIIGGFEK